MKKKEKEVVQQHYGLKKKNAYEPYNLTAILRTVKKRSYNINAILINDCKNRSYEVNN